MSFAKSDLISSAYAELNHRLHEDRSDYGAFSDRHLGAVGGLHLKYDFTSMLDYGSGKGALASAVKSNFPDIAVTEYDPGMPGIDEVPDGKFDLVTCTDVLEHIEPELIDNVLGHIWSCTDLVLYCTIATKPAKKVLADGRNAHLLIRDSYWWQRNITNRGWQFIEWHAVDQGLSFVAEKVWVDG